MCVCVCVCVRVYKLANASVIPRSGKAGKRFALSIKIASAVKIARACTIAFFSNGRPRGLADLADPLVSLALPPPLAPHPASGHAKGHPRYLVFRR